MSKSIKDLSAQEALALAIQNEEEDGRVYSDLAERVRADYPETSKMLMAMHDEENGHRRRLIELYQSRFGQHIPLIRREDVKGFIRRPTLWFANILTAHMIRRQIQHMEDEAQKFYQMAASKAQDAEVRKLFGDLAAEEGRHFDTANIIEHEKQESGALQTEGEVEKRRFVLQVVQPGLAGLMDGSVSTLAPVFAAAFATHSSSDAFLVGLAASLGAGISMGFAEALSDDGVLSGRGRPWARGAVCGLMTAAGGIGHTLPFLIKDFYVAFEVAIAVVILELGIIAWIRHRYMDTSLLSAAFQVVVGGLLVFVTGILIGRWGG